MSSSLVKDLIRTVQEDGDVIIGRKRGRKVHSLQATTIFTSFFFFLREKQ